MVSSSVNMVITIGMYVAIFVGGRLVFHLHEPKSDVVGEYPASFVFFTIIMMMHFTIFLMIARDICKEFKLLFYEARYFNILIAFFYPIAYLTSRELFIMADVGVLIDMFTLPAILYFPMSLIYYLLVWETARHKGQGGSAL